ncbi:MAG: FISUMP domain-containing protein [Paludibacter sp.]
MKTHKHSFIWISTIVLLLFIVTIKTVALNYTISFTASKASNTVSSVEVNNLTNGKSVIVPAGNVLNLSDAPNAVNSVYANGEFISIYPNPIQGKSILSFYSNRAGNAQINIIAPDGRWIAGTANQLSEGDNSFQLSLPTGAYIIKITGVGFSYTARVISQTPHVYVPEITFIGNSKKDLSSLQKSKSATATTLYYTEGDRLLYKGISGNYSTIVTDIPTGSKTVNFEFIECKDGVGNYYSTVKIGTQVWMVENLNTTKYLTGDAIVEVKDDAAWKILTTGAYCDNNNLPDNSLTYGKLYNWYAVNDSRKIAPTGWHVPSNAEWISLSNQLGGASVAGAKLKETGTAHWESPNTATNESGFSAFAGGLRTYDGTFLGSGTTLGSWWTATPVDAIYSYSKRLSNTLSLFFQDSNRENQYGYSVRCVRDISTIPTLTTSDISAITQTTAAGGGNITSDGNEAITARGICWSTTSNPTIDNTKTTDGTTTGTFTSAMTGLTTATTYYVRAYATNSVGTSYGNQVSFTTLATLPTLSTTAIVSITASTATSGGNITSDGGANVTTRGVCWSTTTSPTISGSKTTDGIGTGTFTSAITGLNPNTIYYIRSYATNSVGTVYGNELNFTTLAALPTVSTTAISSITNNAATCGGTITNDGGATITSRGVCWGTSSSPTIANLKTTDGTTTGTFTSSLTGLSNVTTYYVRAYATNSVGTSYGNQVSFTTLATLPTLSTTAIVSITASTATSGGNITSDGGANVTTRGVCWSTTTSPTISGSKTTDGIGTGTFTSAITGLNPNTIYYIRSYATNSVGTVYGNELNFTTLAALPTVSTTAISSITNNAATCGGTITNDGGATITSRGVCWGTNPAPTTVDNKTINGTGIGTFTSSLTGLNNATTYYVRAYATNSVGTSYGNEMSFTTLAALSTLTTTAATSITASTATSGGNITSDGGANVTTRGVCWSTTTSPTISGSKTTDGIGTGTFTSAITGLNPNTIYYIRSYATNSVGTVYGNELNFTTLAALPTVSTTAISSITNNAATCGGTITNDGGATITSRGVCWGTNPAPTTVDNKTINGTGIGTFTSSLTGLNNATTYYVRAYATNSVGTSYGNEMSFTTLAALSTLTTTAATSITASTATSGGNITSDGGANVTTRGVCWSTTTSPTISGSKTTDGIGTGTFTSAITGLNPNTKYYIRSYATNSVGTSYGNEINFTTLAALPTLTSTAISAITNNSVTSGGIITNDGGATVTARGVCWSSTPSPTIVDNKTTDGTGTGIFTSVITGLSNTATYYARAYATNSAGTSYGNELSFITASSSQNLLTNPSFETWSAGVPTGWTMGTVTYATATENTSVFNDGQKSLIVTPVATAGGTYNVSQIIPITPGRTYTLKMSYYIESGDGTDARIWSSWCNVVNSIVTYPGMSHADSILLTGPGGINAYFPDIKGVWKTYACEITAPASGYNSFNFQFRTYKTPAVVYWDNMYFGEKLSVQPSLPIVGNTDISNITSTSATSGGNIISDGGATVTARGVCWNTTTSPTIENSKTIDGTGTGTFISSITGLTPLTTYYVRAYATNSVGTSYSNEQSFTTNSIIIPTITITDVTDILFNCNTGNSVSEIINVSGSNLTSDLNLTISGTNADLFSLSQKTILQSGGNVPNTDVSITYSPTQTGIHNAILTMSSTNAMDVTRNLIGNSSAVNTVPTISSAAIFSITTTGATSGGNITSDGGATVTARGVCWSTTSGPTIANSFSTDGTGVGSFISSLTGLSPTTTYYVRAYATNSVGTSYGNEISFTTALFQPITISFLKPTDWGTVYLWAWTSSTTNIFSSWPGKALLDNGNGWYSYTFDNSISSVNIVFSDNGRLQTVDITNISQSTFFQNSGTNLGKITVVPVVTPVLTTTNPTSISNSTVFCGGIISSDCGTSVTARGVCWNTTVNPTIANSKTLDGSGTGTFTSSITGLTAGTTYYIRAYATNSAGTSYGNEVSFTTYKTQVLMDEIFSNFPTTDNMAIINGWTNYSGNTLEPNGTDYRLLDKAGLSYADLNNTPVLSGQGNSLHNVYVGVSSSSTPPGSVLLTSKSFSTTAITTGTVYASFFIQPMTQGGTMGQTVSLSDSIHRSAMSLWIRQGSTGSTFKLGITRSSGASSDIVNGLNEYSYGTVNFVVMKYDLTTQVAYLYVNPAIGSASEPIEYAKDDGTFNPLTISPARIAMQYLMIANKGANKSNYYVSGIRVCQSWSDAVAASALPKVATPTIGSATTIGAESFTANWTPTSDANGYTVLVYNGTSLFSKITVTDKTASSYQITGLVSNTTYTYEVQAIGNGSSTGNSTPSAASVSFTTLDGVMTVQADFSNGTWGAVYPSSVYEPLSFSYPSFANGNYYVSNGLNSSSMRIGMFLPTNPTVRDTIKYWLKLDRSTAVGGSYLALPSMKKLGSMELHMLSPGPGRIFLVQELTADGTWKTDYTLNTAKDTLNNKDTIYTLNFNNNYGTKIRIINNSSGGSIGIGVVKASSGSSPISISTALIPAGTFIMGSPTSEVDRGTDETEHSVPCLLPHEFIVWQVKKINESVQ